LLERERIAEKVDDVFAQTDHVFEGVYGITDMPAIYDPGELCARVVSRPRRFISTLWTDIWLFMQEEGDSACSLHAVARTIFLRCRLGSPAPAM
jgi:hypothetical protein